MRKKYLSALLFGALLFASAGTFTSCKDYDDDINNLQSQITSNKDAIAALQKLVGEGKWVSSISPIENGFTITMSDGSTQNITGINGEDGKPGTVISLDPTTYNWIIDGVDTGICAKGEKGDKGDQGEQGEQGVAGENGAAGAQGEPGQNAPSPQIDPETGNWIVYVWDEATGDYKATVTDVYAQATKVFVVEKEGFIELNVDGVAYLLPTTSDTYIVEALADQIKVIFQTAEWSKWNSNDADAKTLLKVFPELEKIEKGTIVKQGGNLPLIVTPASIELNDEYTFTLVNLKGKVADIKLSSPVKGLPKNIDFNEDGAIESRSTDASSCLWTLTVEPAFDEKKKSYKSTDGRSSLLVENAKGTIARTAYSYTVSPEDLTKEDLTIKSNQTVKYAKTIDVLEKTEDADAMFTLENAYDGYVVLEATNAVQREKYGITIDGTKLTIGNMPANETEINITLKLTAVGLNGEAKSKEETFTITQGVETTGILTDKTVTLNVDPNKAPIRWNLADLKFSAVQLDNFLNGDVTLTATREKDDKKYVAYNGKVTYYNAEGKETEYNKETASWNNGDAVTFGFNVDAAKTSSALEGYTAEQFTENVYEITLQSIKGTSVIYSADAKLTVSNPAVADILRLNPEFVENGVLQVTAVPVGDYVTYDFTSGIIIANAYTNALGDPDFIDVDFETFKENGGDITSSTAFENYNWVEGNELQTNIWKSGNNIPANQQHMYHVRNIRAEYPLFGNENNKIEFNFQVEVKSQVYSDQPAKVITFDEDKLVAVYGSENNNSVDIKKAVKSAVFALGSDKGKSYTLFATAAGPIKATGYQYGNIDGLNTNVTEGDRTQRYMLDKNNMFIELKVSDMNYLGYSGSDILAAQTGKKFYLTAANYNELWNNVKDKSYFTNSGDYYALNNSEAANKDVDYTKFSYYADKIAFASKKDITVGVNKAEKADSRIKSVAIKAVDANYAAKFIENINEFNGKLNLNAFQGSSVITVKDVLDEGVSETVTVDMQLIVTDIWNKTMYVPFKLTINTAE